MTNVLFPLLMEPLGTGGGGTTIVAGETVVELQTEPDIELGPDEITVELEADPVIELETDVEIELGSD